MQTNHSVVTEGMSGTTEASAPPAGRRGRGRPPIDPAVRRKRILDAATELFLARGFVGTNIDDVCKLAAVTKRTFYEIVEDKEALFREVVRERCIEGGDFTFELPIQDMSLREIATAIARGCLTYALGPTTIGMNRTIAMASVRFPDLVMESMQAGKVVLNSAIARVFADLMAAGRIPEYEPSEVADIFYDTIVGNRPLRMVMGFKEPPMSETQLEKRLDMLLAGLLDPPR